MLLRPATPADVDAVAALHERENRRPADRDVLRRCLADYPAAVAYLDTDTDTPADGGLAGFGYCGSFAPDLLELRNLLVTAPHRSAGLGGQLLALLETMAAPRWAGLVLVNSDAYPTPGKRPATRFYLRHGYQLVWSTPSTRVFAKALRPGGSA